MKRILLAAALVSCSAALQAKTWVIPHVLEKSGMSVAAVNTAGLNGTRPSGGGANIELYLYTDNGKLMEQVNGRAVCNPCRWRLTGDTRKQVIDVSALVRSAAPRSRTGFGIVVANGADAPSVNLQGFVVNSHDSGLSVFGFEPQPIAAEAQ